MSPAVKLLFKNNNRKTRNKILNDFTKYVSVILMAYCVGILSHIGYQHLFNSTHEAPEYTDKIDNSEPELIHMEKVSVIDERSVNKLELELAIVKAELKELREKNRDIADAKTVSAKNVSAEKKRIAELMKYFSSPENTKKRAHQALIAVKNELKGVLNLTDAQSSILNELLKNKVDDYLDAVDSINAAMSKEEKVVLAEEVKSQIEANQRNFEQQLSNELSEEQIESYLVYEQEKVKQLHSASMVYHESHLLSTFSDLDEYQKNEIKQYFHDLEPNLDNIKIGGFGTPGNYQRQRYHLDKEALLLHLELVLTNEQFKHYIEQTKKK